MRNKYINNIAFFIIGILISGCSNKSNEFFDPSYWSGPYKGITFTDRSGILLKIDPGDWCVEYGVPENSSHVIPNTGTYAFLPAFPNPVDRKNEKINIMFLTKEESNIEIFIDDDEFHTVRVLADGTFIKGLHILEWDLKNEIGNKVPSGIYRCYMFSNNFSCHGDIWIK